MHGIRKSLSSDSSCANLAYFRFMKDLRDKCTSEPGNRQFWVQVQEAGRSMSLISDKEAEEHGGTSAISESKAEKVRRAVIHACFYPHKPQVPRLMVSFSNPAFAVCTYHCHFLYSANWPIKYIPLTPAPPSTQQAAQTSTSRSCRSLRLRGFNRGVLFRSLPFLHHRLRCHLRFFDWLQTSPRPQRRHI